MSKYKQTHCGIAHILGILLMNSCNTDIFFSNYYHLQSVRFNLLVFCISLKLIRRRRLSHSGYRFSNETFQFTLIKKLRKHVVSLTLFFLNIWVFGESASKWPHVVFQEFFISDITVFYTRNGEKVFTQFGNTDLNRFFSASSF